MLGFIGLVDDHLLDFVELMHAIEAGGVFAGRAGAQRANDGAPHDGAPHESAAPGRMGP